MTKDEVFQKNQEILVEEFKLEREREIIWIITHL